MDGFLIDSAAFAFDLNSIGRRTFVTGVLANTCIETSILESFIEHFSQHFASYFFGVTRVFRREPENLTF